MLGEDPRKSPHDLGESWPQPCCANGLRTLEDFEIYDLLLQRLVTVSARVQNQETTTCILKYCFLATLSGGGGNVSCLACSSRRLYVCVRHGIDQYKCCGPDSTKAIMPTGGLGCWANNTSIWRRIGTPSSVSASVLIMYRMGHERGLRCLLFYCSSVRRVLLHNIYFLLVLILFRKVVVLVYHLCLPFL